MNSLAFFKKFGLIFAIFYSCMRADICDEKLLLFLELFYLIYLFNGLLRGLVLSVFEILLFLVYF